MKREMLRRVRSFISIFALVFILNACQATPDELIVQSKAGDALEEAIEATPDPNNHKKGDGVGHVSGTFQNNSETISVRIDADVGAPYEDLPVAKIEPSSFSQQLIDRIINTLVGDSKMYEGGNFRTKSDIDKAIIQVKKDALDLESDLAQSNGITNLTELLNMQIRRYQDY